MPLKIGILSGHEVFTNSLIEEINKKGRGEVTAEFCQIKETKVFEPSGYRVIIDRISHCVDYYRTYLKNAALSGTYVINNPFWFSADDKFYNYALATKLGIAIPKTLCLPSKEYSEDLEEGDLKNLVYPLNWREIAEYIGFPSVLKPYDGYGWRDVFKVDNMEELQEAYDESGEQVMVLQEFIKFEHYVRVFAIGKKYILPIKYDPLQRKYMIDHKHLSDELGKRIVEDSIKINEALGYDMNTIEFAIREGVPYAIDFMNPVPEAKPYVITEGYFKWVVEHLAKVAIEYALSGATTPFRLS
ncbi:MAG: hypothetical protein M1536_04225 [Firmicutes bacterium]|nr:hypothetical protein [Bacillota bacterium]